MNSHGLSFASPYKHVVTYLPVLLTIGLLALFGVGGWYAYTTNTHITTLESQVVALSDSLASTTALLSANIADSHSTLAQALADEQTRINTVRDQLSGVAGQVGTISSDVTTLSKLTTTDKELLAKYSKVFFLSENYEPARLSEIPNQYKYFDDRTMQLIPEVEPRLEQMIEDAKASGVTLYVYSAYRSFKSQEILKGAYTVTYGSGTANQFSADQGYSEHQLGTALDIMTTGLNGELTNAFADTAAFAWLADNAHRYGFILSYPQGNEYYIYEPWHWRFVGVKLATYLHDNNLSFYDLDQRTIDTYLANLFD